MPGTHRTSITTEQWDEAAAAYELGYKHASQIARELRVSAATVSREFKRRGCVKAGRIAETVAEIKARLEAEGEVKARAKATRDAERMGVVDGLIDELMDVLLAASRTGHLTMADPDVARIDKALQLAMR